MVLIKAGITTMVRCSSVMPFEKSNLGNTEGRATRVDSQLIIDTAS